MGADRILYDQAASISDNERLDNGLIISINPARKTAEEIAAEYGQVLQVLNGQGIERIVIAQAPDVDNMAALPGFSETLGSELPLFVPSDHRLASSTTASGVLTLQPDSDEVLRRSRLWNLQSGAMSP